MTPVADARHRARDERGSVTVWVMVVPLLLALMGGVTLDLWSALSVRARLAAIADDAAAAGATAVTETSLRAGAPDLDPDMAHDTAVAAVVGHADAARVHALEVLPTTSAVSVTVTGSATLHLLRMVGPAEIELTATGVAAPDVRGG